MMIESPVRIKPLVFAIDGESDFLQAIKELLEEEGYTAQVMLIADQPFAEIVRAQPDLLLIDFPYRNDQSFWALLAQIDAHPVTRMIPSIALSTDPGKLTAFADRAGAANPSTTILKPFELELIVTTIAEYLPTPARQA